MNRNTGYINTNPNLISGLESLYGKDSLKKAAESKSFDEDEEDPEDKKEESSIEELED